jgi:hypothetical protein
MQCKQCDRPFQRHDWVASISGSIMGDEHTDSYFLCPACRVYTVVTDWDDFTGVENTSVSGPLPRAEGDERVELIRKCAQPWDKQCRCAAHLTYFNSTLD